MDPVTAEIARLLKAQSEARSRERCRWKLQYTKAEAKRMLKTCKAKGRSERQIYRCPHCGLFHLTSQPV